ncbi:hypothetical protein V1514DRAFT_323295 [Lipomyces japonicus]|uniref:uncharacterized protein n=1 Tax=Lipomyces japonicus TaxID=56871 RepID=UPI0034CFA729
MSFDNRTIEPDVPTGKGSALSSHGVGSPLASSPGLSNAPPPAYTATSSTSPPLAGQQARTGANGPSAVSASASASTPLGPYPTGNLQSQSFAGDQIQDRRFAGGDTLDEPVVETLMRDVRAVGRRVKQVLNPKTDANVDVESGQIIRDWDLWGPLIFCLFLSLALSISAPANQSSLVFSGVFAFVWLAESFVTLNIKLLGGSISFFHAVCILGYALFPLVPAAIISLIFKSLLVRLPIDIVLVGWSLFASMRTFKGAGVRQGRVFLAMYPVFLFYGWLGWLCVIT